MCQSERSNSQRLREAVDVDVSITTSTVGAVQVVAVGGEIDVHTAPQVDEALEAVAGPGVAIVADLSKVEFIDSTGLSVLVRALARSRDEDGSLAVVAPTERVTKVLRLTGLDAVLAVYDSVDAAVAGA
jgi:anti-sigma B factor antagonist